MPRVGGLPRSPPIGVNTPASNRPSVYDAHTVTMETPSGTIKRRKPDFESSKLDGALENAIADLTVLVQTLVSDNRMLKKELADIKKQLCSLVGANTTKVDPPVSFASVAASKVLIINPVSEKLNPDASRKIIKTKLKPIDYNLYGVSSTKKGGVIVQCPTSAEREKLRTDATSQLGDEFVVSAPGKTRPRVRIFGFTEELNAIDLVKTLRDQNANIFGSEPYIGVVHIFKGKDTPRFGAKIEVDAATFKNMLDAKKMFIGWDSCSVSEDLNIRRCYKCWGFNHISSKCELTQRCSKCSGSHHKNECDSAIEKCAVCSDAVSLNHLKIDINHSVFSSSCPSYLHRVYQQRSRIDYGQ